MSRGLIEARRHGEAEAERVEFSAVMSRGLIEAPVRTGTGPNANRVLRGDEPRPH